MLHYLSPPHLITDDFYENARMRLTWNINIFLVLMLFPLMLISISIQSIYFYYYLSSLLLIASSLVYLRRTSNYKPVAIILAFVLYLLILLSLFSVNNYLHYIEPFWALIIVLYVYFIRGKFLGGIILAINIVSTSIFFVFYLNPNVVILSQMSPDRLIMMAVEFSICLILIGYILHQFINSTQYAEQALLKMNEELRNEKELVENRNQEKTILLQEIHHRVKNNLQIVMSLLRMQASKIESEEAKEHFADAINRVLTMSLIHQRLYESENLSAIDLSEYLESLSTDILRSNHQPKHIKKELSIEIRDIDLKSIIPLALIITELISNSAKHAFEDTDHPEIKLCINYLSDSDLIEMKYSDNGTWKDSNQDSFGTQLIEALTEQLEGSVDLTIGSDGSHYTFHFNQLH